MRTSAQREHFLFTYDEMLPTLFNLVWHVRLKRYAEYGTRLGET